MISPLRFYFIATGDRCRPSRACIKQQGFVSSTRSIGAKRITIHEVHLHGEWSFICVPGASPQSASQSLQSAGSRMVITLCSICSSVVPAKSACGVRLKWTRISNRPGAVIASCPNKERNPRPPPVVDLELKRPQRSLYLTSGVYVGLIAIARRQVGH